MSLTQKLHLAALGREEIISIHQATLRVLSEVGVIMDHPEAVELLMAAGATQAVSSSAATAAKPRLCLPPGLVESALAHCPPTVSTRGRANEITLGDGKLHWHNLGGARDVYDPELQQVRPAGVQDVIQAARLLDTLDQCTCITPFFTPQDVPGELMSLAMYRHTLPHTTKPVYGPGVQNATEVQFAVRMAEVIGPASEVMLMAISPVSPLNFPSHLTGAMLETARNNLPFGPLPCPTAGTTAPLSLAGALAQQNAEVLASIVLAQLARPGLPIIYCGRLAMMEPRTGVSVWGGVELALASAATVQLAHYYHLPVNVYGFSTNSHTLDLQNGYERAINAVIPALAGADELSGIGEMAAGVAASYAQMVIDNEIAGGVQRLRHGFATDADALAVEVIGAAMDTSRNFLSQQHTRRFLKAGEIYLPRLAERGSWAEWEKRGRGSLAVQAQAEVNRLLNSHTAPPLDPAQERALDEIMVAAHKALVR